MQTLGDLLFGSNRGKNISTGYILEVKKPGQYIVSINGKSTTAKSDELFNVSDRVVVSDTKTGKYIIGSGGRISRSPLEVIING